MWLLNAAAAMVGKTVRAVCPPKPPQTYPETPDVIAARQGYENAQRILDQQLARQKREMSQALKRLERAKRSK